MLELEVHDFFFILKIIFIDLLCLAHPALFVSNSDELWNNFTLNLFISFVLHCRIFIFVIFFSKKLSKVILECRLLSYKRFQFISGGIILYMISFMQTSFKRFQKYLCRVFFVQIFQHIRHYFAILVLFEQFGRFIRLYTALFLDLFIEIRNHVLAINVRNFILEFPFSLQRSIIMVIQNTTLIGIDSFRIILIFFQIFLWWFFAKPRILIADHLFKSSIHIIYDKLLLMSFIHVGFHLPRRGYLGWNRVMG